MSDVDVKEKINQLHSLKNHFEGDVKDCSQMSELEQVRIKYLSKKGLLNQFYSILGRVGTGERPLFGKELNDVRNKLNSIFKEKVIFYGDLERKKEMIDISLPGIEPFLGTKHPLTQTLEEIKEIFSFMGFEIEEGPEIENDYYNFEALNLPENHPAREMHDTLYLENGSLLRTHTSTVQIRVMESKQPPIRMIAPGRCYRKDTPDASHSPFFYQVEGLCVDEGITFADLKGVVSTFGKKMFGEDVRVRFRPSFFPFTEPSAEYDFSCIICKGKGCKTCKGTGWLEIAGAGMVDPNVFKFVGYDSEKYTGYAFGMGVERIAMLKHGINDIRYLYENDLRFLKQF
jgi:phenylalanyl-tRNA synthetase alpha chain